MRSIGRMLKEDWELAVASGKRLWDAGSTNLAGMLAFYSLLSLFPLILVLVAMLGLWAGSPQAVAQLLDLLSEFAPEAVVQTIKGPLTSISQNANGAGVAISVGLIVSLWSASGYVGTFGWASNAVEGVREKRPYLGRLFQRLGIACLAIAAMVAAFATIALSQRAARWLGKWSGSPDTFLQVWSYLRWPIFVGLAFLLVVILMGYAPFIPSRRLRHVMPGALVGIVLWGLASQGFSIYLDFFNYYNKTYGAIATFIVFLLWLWLFNLALLYGESVNAELHARRRGLLPAKRE